MAKITFKSDHIHLEKEKYSVSEYYKGRKLRAIFSIAFLLFFVKNEEHFYEYSSLDTHTGCPCIKHYITERLFKSSMKV